MPRKSSAQNEWRFPPRGDTPSLPDVQYSPSRKENATHGQSGDSAGRLFRGTRPGEPTRPIAFQPVPVASAGGPFRLAQGSQLGSAVLHPQDGVEVLHWIPCDGIPTALWRERFSVSGRPAESSSGRKGMGYTLPDTMFWGLGVEGDTVVYALTWKDGDDRVTSVNLAPAGECGSVELFGSWMLYGLDRRLMLLARQDPFPAVEVVSWDWIRAQLRAARCRAAH